jgi:hypothetical protein
MDEGERKRREERSIRTLSLRAAKVTTSDPPKEGSALDASGRMSRTLLLSLRHQTSEKGHVRNANTVRSAASVAVLMFWPTATISATMPLSGTKPPAI